jgi:hypothetical protein
MVNGMSLVANMNTGRGIGLRHEKVVYGYLVIGKKERVAGIGRKATGDKKINIGANKQKEVILINE